MLGEDSQQCLFVTGADFMLDGCSLMTNEVPIKLKKKTDSPTKKSNLEKGQKGEMVLRFLSLICDKHRLNFSALTFKLLLPRGDLIDALGSR